MHKNRWKYRVYPNSIEFNDIIFNKDAINLVEKGIDDNLFVTLR